MARILPEPFKIPDGFPKIEWVCFPTLIVGQFEGKHDTAGSTIDAKSAAIVKAALLVIRPIRNIVYEFGNIGMFYHRFTFPDEDGFIWARKLNEKIEVRYPDRSNIDVVAHVVKLMRIMISQRHTTYSPDTYRASARFARLVWDEEDDEQIKQARQQFEKLKHEGFRAITPFCPAFGEAQLKKPSRVCRCSKIDDLPLTETLRPYLDFLRKYKETELKGALPAV